MTTFKQQQQRITDLKHELAVWEMLFNHLDSDFTSKDGRGVKHVLVAEGCLETRVPEAVVEHVLRTIHEDKMQTLQQEIDAIENQEMVLLTQEDMSA